MEHSGRCREKGWQQQKPSVWTPQGERRSRSARQLSRSAHAGRGGVREERRFTIPRRNTRRYRSIYRIMEEKN